jgi:hypothetical protein
LEDADHVAGVLFFGAAAAAEGLCAQDLVLAQGLDPVEGCLVVVAGAPAPAPSWGWRGDNVEAAR